MRVRERSSGITHEEVIEIIDALTDIKVWTWDILAILSEEDDDEP